MEIIAKGIDISKHNSINWEKVTKSKDLDFVIIRAGYGKNTVDAKFRVNIESAIKKGLGVGIYWFSYAESAATAQQEANFCLKTINEYRKYITYPVFFDWENDSYNYILRQYGIQPTKQLVSNMARSFMNTISSAGYKTGNYSNKDYLNRFFDTDIKNNYDIWLAHVGKNGTPLYESNYQGKYVMHQYSWKGRPQGFLSDTDMNYCFKNYSIAANNEQKKEKIYQIPENINFLTDVNKNVITTYIYAKSKDKFLSDHFQVKEFASKNNNGGLYDEKVKIHNKLIIILEALFKELNCSKIIVSSGYRSTRHNEEVLKNSNDKILRDAADYHLTGRAADIVCYNKQGNIISAKRVCCALEDIGGVYGIAYISSSVAHIDTRPKNKKLWGDISKNSNIEDLGYFSFHDYFNI